MNNIDKYEILRRLTQAISVLEKAIVSSRESLKARGNLSLEAFQRLDSYTQIVNQQKKELPQIAIHIANNDMQNLQSSYDRINALSELVREDAKEFLGVITNPQAKPFRPEMLN